MNETLHSPHDSTIASVQTPNKRERERETDSLFFPPFSQAGRVSPWFCSVFSLLCPGSMELQGLTSTQWGRLKGGGEPGQAEARQSSLVQPKCIGRLESVSRGQRPRHTLVHTLPLPTLGNPLPRQSPDTLPSPPPCVSVCLSLSFFHWVVLQQFLMQQNNKAPKHWLLFGFFSLCLSSSRAGCPFLYFFLSLSLCASLLAGLLHS